MVTALLELDHDMYQPFIVYERGEPVLYVQLLKALYGTVWAARLFYEVLKKQLVDMGFKINPYDTCVANKMIEGKQCTMIWHVDDLKISHVSAKVVDEIIDQLDEKFGKETPISRNRGKFMITLG